MRLWIKLFTIHNFINLYQMDVHVITQKYALLVGFEYSKYIPHPCDKPSQLISIDLDLLNMWTLCVDTFKIPRRNITIITDIQVDPRNIKPWDVMGTNKDGNPYVIRMEYPRIDLLVAELIQFVENSVRDILPIKGDEVIKREVFVYFSGHGAYVPHPVRKKESNGFIVLDAECQKRVYIHDREIFQILFGQLEVKDDKDESKGGYMSVPVVYRRINGTNVSFVETEITINVNPSPSKHNRGLPYETVMLVTFDTCHSGTMIDLPYMYSPGDKNKGIKPHMMRIESTITEGPRIVCIGATNDSQVAPSADARYKCSQSSELLT